jgi:MoxR-like ATPase
VAAFAVRIARATREPAVLAEAVGRSDSGRRLLSEAAQLREILRTDPVLLGASPRASIFLARAARARALLDGRSYVTPHDVKRAAPDVLRHRVVVSYEAEADGITPERVIEAVLASVESP